MCSHIHGLWWHSHKEPPASSACSSCKQSPNSLGLAQTLTSGTSPTQVQVTAWTSTVTFLSSPESFDSLRLVRRPATLLGGQIWPQRRRQAIRRSWREVYPVSCSGPDSSSNSIATQQKPVCVCQISFLLSVFIVHFME